LGLNDVNSALSLHTAARRYCLKQHAFWCARYSEIVHSAGDRERDGFNYTTEALATFPRYNVLHAILVELERIEPARLSDLENARSLLILSGDAEDDFTRHPINEIAQRAMSDERFAFCRYVRELTLSDLSAVEALPNRRVLTAEESKSIWSRLRTRWQIPVGFWYPLAECTVPGVVAFNAGAFQEAVPPERLQDILAAYGVRCIWELREYGPEYEQDVSLCKPYYNGAEGYWSSGDMDWIIYASHESSVTIAGWLLPELKRIWTSWKAHLWTGSFE
jgi:hypothetical protein